MEEELNYISEKIEALDNKISELYDNLDGRYGVGCRIGGQYRVDLKRMSKEKQILENIMNYITQNEHESHFSVSGILLSDYAQKKLEYINGSCIARDFPKEQPTKEWAGAVLDLLEDIKLGNYR